MTPFRPRRVRLAVEALEGRCLPSTFTVTNLNDAGPGSLRQAVANANDEALHPGADTVVFRPGLEGTIFLTSGQVPITGPLALRGPGASKVAVDATGADGSGLARCFSVSDGTPAEIAVTIQGLELRNALHGAVYSLENLSLVKAVISSNRSVGGAAV